MKTAIFQNCKVFFWPALVLFVNTELSFYFMFKCFFLFGFYLFSPPLFFVFLSFFFFFFNRQPAYTHGVQFSMYCIQVFINERVQIPWHWFPSDHPPPQLVLFFFFFFSGMINGFFCSFIVYRLIILLYSSTSLCL